MRLADHCRGLLRLGADAASCAVLTMTRTLAPRCWCGLFCQGEDCDEDSCASVLARPLVPRIMILAGDAASCASISADVASRASLIIDEDSCASLSAAAAFLCLGADH